MIQTQILAVDNETRGQLLTLSSLIRANSGDPERLKRLIAEHDAIITRSQPKDYDPSEEAKWA